MPVGQKQEVKPQEARLDTNLELRVGQSAAVTGETLSLTFDRVSSDSRCPVGVNCVWAGDAVLLFKVTGPKGDGTVDLHTQQIGREATFQGFKIRLVTLVPNTTASEKIPVDRYAATLTISKVK